MVLLVFWITFDSGAYVLLSELLSAERVKVPLDSRNKSDVLKELRAPIDEALKGVFTRPQITRLRRHLGIGPDFAAGFLSAIERHVPKEKWSRMKRKKRISI